jgi:hypothetical protein
VITLSPCASRTRIHAITGPNSSPQGVGLDTSGCVLGCTCDCHSEASRHRPLLLFCATLVQGTRECNRNLVAVGTGQPPVSGLHEPGYLRDNCQSTYAQQSSHQRYADYRHRPRQQQDSKIAVKHGRTQKEYRVPHMAPSWLSRFVHSRFSR